MIKLFKEDNHPEGYQPEYGILTKSRDGKDIIVCFQDKEDAYEFLNAADVYGVGYGSDIWDAFDGKYDFLSRKDNKPIRPDRTGSYWYVCYTPEGEEFLQEVRLLNNKPLT